MISKYVGLFACAVLVGFPSLNAETYRYMNSDEIRSLLTDKTIKQVDDQYYAYYADSGQVRALYVNAEEAGSWKITNSQVCHKWRTWNKGKEACFGVIPGQQGAYRFQDIYSSEGFNFTLASGNSRGL